LHTQHNKIVLSTLLSLYLAGCGGADSTAEDTLVGTDLLVGIDRMTDTIVDGSATVDADATVDIGAECIDTDNDGWGWNGITSCAVELADLPVIVREKDNCEKISSGDYHVTELVTDVFLTAGQSNATGDATLYDPDQYENDRVNNRVIVWTENNKWEIANPAEQIWNNGIYPGKDHREYNHPGFQIARGIADLDECRVVAFIATAASGMQIDHWRNNENNHYNDISDKVTSALNALPGRYQIDMIWWMQGEADDDQIVSRYFYKLSDLIGRFRSETWFSHDSYFLANETRLHPYANEAIRMLNSDSDSYSDFSRGEQTPTDNFPPVSDEGPEGVHFGAESLRKIGDIVASKYIYEYSQMRSNSAVP